MSKVYRCPSGIGNQDFSLSGDDFETPSSKDWGDISRLLGRWGTPTLGASVFLPLFSSLFMFAIIVSNSLFLVLHSKEMAQAQEQV